MDTTSLEVTPQSSPIKAWLVKKIDIARVLLLLAIGLILLASFHADAGIVSSSNVVKNEISSLVNSIVNGNSPLNRMTWIFFWAFTFFLIMKNVFFYVMTEKGFSFEDVVVELVYFFFALILLLNFDWYTKVMWEYSNGVASEMQKLAFGNDDPFFLTKYIIDIVSNIEITGIGMLTDGIQLIGAVLIYEALALGLGAMAKITALWGTWGYALAKLIGPMFIPFFLLEPTRFIYSGWLRFFLGFLLFNIMIKAATIIVAFQVRSDFIDIGGSMSGSTGSSFAVVQKVIIKKGPLMQAALGDMIATSVLALLFVWMAGKAAGSLVGGGGGGSGGAGKGIQKAVSMAMGKFK